MRGKHNNHFKKGDEVRTATINQRIEPSVKEQLKQIADARDVSVADLIAEIPRHEATAQTIMETLGRLEAKRLGLKAAKPMHYAAEMSELINTIFVLKAVLNGFKTGCTKLLEVL